MKPVFRQRQNRDRKSAARSDFSDRARRKLDVSDRLHSVTETWAIVSDQTWKKARFIEKKEQASQANRTNR